MVRLLVVFGRPNKECQFLLFLFNRTLLHPFRHMYLRPSPTEEARLLGITRLRGCNVPNCHDRHCIHVLFSIRQTFRKWRYFY